MGKDIHVVKQDNGWAIKKSGSDRASKIVQTQAEAKKVAIQQAKREHSEVLIHGKNGKIRERNTYKKDPFPPKG